MIWGTILSLGARALPFLKSPKVIGGGIALLAVFGLWWYVTGLQDDLIQAESDKKMFVRYLNECQLSNVENQRTIKDLQHANGLLANSVRVKEDERIAAIEAAAQRELEAKLRLDDTLDTLEELQNESISCNALMETDIGAVCPLTDQRLREHAAGTISQD